MRKKSQAISINTIVVAAIALVVLILIILIFTQNIKNFRQSSDSCESVGGNCYAEDELEDSCNDNYQRVTNHPCFDSSGEVREGYSCCLTV